MSDKTTIFDVAIIGSGLGSLACASFIAQMYGQRVVVIEQHSQPGGLSRALQLSGGPADMAQAGKEASFEIGIHQVGELDPSSMFSKLMAYISQGQSVWRRLPETFIKFHFPDLVYEVTAGEANQIRKLTELFPEEEENIAAYYRDVASITRWYRNYTTESATGNMERLQGLMDLEPGRLAMMTTEEYLRYRFTNAKLRSLIASHWTDYGLPPSLSAFLKHAILVNNHKEGVYYPELGSTHLIGSIVKSIEDAGGELKLDTLVKEIRYEGNRASEMTVIDKLTSQETIIRARAFVSGISIINTYTKLLDKRLVGDQLRSLGDLSRHGVSFVSLFATLKDNPEIIGADASLSWVYPGYDHESNFYDRDKLDRGWVSQFSISFPSLKKRDGFRHTMKINSLADISMFDGGWDKERIGKTLLAAAEKVYPGLTDLIGSWDLYTPLSARRDTQHHNGNIFGIPDTPQRFRNPDFSCYTPLENVYLTGCDITTSGIYGAVLSGALTATAIFKDKRFFLNIIQAVEKYGTAKTEVPV